MATHDWTPEEKLTVWEKATKIDGRDPNEWRLDPCGDLIHWADYGNDTSPYGWEIDHVIPQAHLEACHVLDSLIHHTRNLRPMKASNNARKSDDYPVYSYVRKVYGCEVCRDYEVNRELQRDLYYLYGEYFQRAHQTLASLPKEELQWIDHTFGALPTQDSEWLGRVMNQYYIPFPDSIIKQSIYDLD